MIALESNSRQRYAQYGLAELLARIEALEESSPGPWETPTEVNAKIEAFEVECRTEQGGSVVRFAGRFTVKEAIKSTEKLFNIPAACRPTGGKERFAVVLNASTAGTGRSGIATTGVVNYVGNEIGAGSVVSMEFTFRIK
jgi:hypothetical protein